jgi:hypothetical protein
MSARSTPKKKPVAKTKAPVGKTENRHENSSDFDPEIALPIDFTGRAFTSIGSGNYYPFFAPSDTLFRKLLTLRLLSPTQSNCINDKTLYSIGAGLQVMDQDFPEKFDKKINGKRQTIDDVLKGVFESYWQDGNDFIEVVRTEVAGEKYVHVYKHNNLDCRFAEPDDGEDPIHVIRSKEFRRDGILTFKKDVNPIKIPIWTDNPVDESEIWLTDPNNPMKTRTMLVVRNEIQGIDHYGLPSNFAGFIQAYLEYNVARFNLDNFENNMFLAGVLSIMGQVSESEAKKLLTDIRKTYMGKGKQRRILTISSEQGINDTKFIPFTQTNEGHFVEFDKHNEGKIIGANSWSKELLDMHDKSGLGKGGDYLAQLFKRKFHTTIIPAQQTVLNNFIFPLMQIIDEYKGTKFYDLPWSIKPVIPIGLEGYLDINSLLTVDEGREEMGKAPLGDDRGKQMISQVKGKPATGNGSDSGQNNNQNTGGAE